MKVLFSDCSRNAFNSIASLNVNYNIMTVWWVAMNNYHLINCDKPQGAFYSIRGNAVVVGKVGGGRRGGGGSNMSTFTFLSDVGALDLRFNTACRSCSDDDDDDD